MLCIYLAALSLLMTSPSASRDRLILAPSFSRPPAVPAFFCLSDPARSTRFKYEILTDTFPPSVPPILFSVELS